jgi:hypothetical protein
MAALGSDELTALAAREMEQALPGARGATLVRATVVREKQATFSLAAGQPSRPGSATAVDGLYLAGDWIDTGLPGTIESAVVSGHRAAGLVAGRDSGLGTRDSGLGTRDSGLGTRGLGLGSRNSEFESSPCVPISVRVPDPESRPMGAHARSTIRSWLNCWPAADSSQELPAPSQSS